MPAPQRDSVVAHPIRTLAPLLSIMLHVAVIWAVGRAPWGVPDAPAAAPVARVVWLREAPPLARRERVLPEPDRVPPEPERVPREPERVPPAPAQTDVPAEAQPPARAGASPAPETDGAPRPRRSYLVPGIDFEEERERAVAKVLEDRMREERYLTFSTDDLFEEPQAEAPNPREGIFDNPQRGTRGGPGAALTPGRSRSRFLNRLAEICNALTGGLGIGFQGLDLGSACADPGPMADYFADVRPEYMNKLPVCTQNEALAALGAIYDADGNEIPTIKCRLVDVDELTGLPVVPE